MTPTWLAYHGLRDDGRCDVCRQPATHALVKLHRSGTFAETLLRLVCAAHRPAESPFRDLADGDLAGEDGLVDQGLVGAPPPTPRGRCGPRVADA